ncbi:hypothetical protein CHS0354_001937 [Potamilus streckersoni]|uniref:Cytidyltransferase-like domain-containing protein n=1 Tax=Potamilus streckersoni TaxID=2493646 RepID=A0AAE0T5C0_9BIVA|nr:hypothetical protein CHS0354_001937 [Potamilus streckersoni]
MAVLTSRLGIFGGSFNPVHLGHYEIVKAFLDHYPEDSVRIFPAVRLEMVRRTFTGLKRATVDLFEIQHPYPSYTADTIAHVKKFFTGELVLIMGYDCYLEFHRWQRTGYILDACSLVVFYRKGVAAVANPHVPA